MESIKLEAGKFYRTKGGQKAYVAAVLAELSGWGAHCFYGEIIDAKGAKISRWRDDGDNVSRDDHNLVAEWVEPKRIKGHLSFYRNEQGKVLVFFDETREQADRAALQTDPRYSPREACVEIDVLEGHGLEGGAA